VHRILNETSLIALGSKPIDLFAAGLPVSKLNIELPYIVNDVVDTFQRLFIKIYSQLGTQSKKTAHPKLIVTYLKSDKVVFRGPPSTPSTVGLLKSQ